MNLLQLGPLDPIFLSLHILSPFEWKGRIEKELGKSSTKNEVSKWHSEYFLNFTLFQSWFTSNEWFWYQWQLSIELDTWLSPIQKLDIDPWLFDCVNSKLLGNWVKNCAEYETENQFRVSLTKFNITWKVPKFKIGNLSNKDFDFRLRV